MPLKPRPLTDRIREKIAKNAETGCWEWAGARTREGYGVMHHGGRQHGAHRLSWEAANGPIAPGLHIDHLCRNRCCVNPDHLEPVTPRENVLRSPIAPSAINARKTHCDKGHELTPDNLDSYMLKKGHRACKECMRATCRAYHARNRAARLQYMAQQRARRRALAASQ
jgi:hypothetical protein